MRCTTVYVIMSIQLSELNCYPSMLPYITLWFKIINKNNSIRLAYLNFSKTPKPHLYDVFVAPPPRIEAPKIKPQKYSHFRSGNPDNTVKKKSI